MIPPIPPLYLAILKASKRRTAIVIAMGRREALGIIGIKSVHLLDAHTRAQRVIEDRFRRMREVSNANN